MKIRILDNSIRLRLDRDEVDRIGAGEQVEAVTNFPDGSAFRYALGSHADGDTSAAFQQGCIRLSIARSEAQDWAADDTRVAITGAQTVTNGDLRLLIEKDFECLDPREGEDQSNRFRNPKAG